MKLCKFIKNLVFSILYLFAVNLVLSKIGCNIPINVFTIGIVYLLKFPGLVVLLFLSRW